MMEIRISGLTGIGTLPRSFFEENVSLEKPLFDLLESKVKVLFSLPLNGFETSFHLVIPGARRKPIHKDFTIKVKKKEETEKGEILLNIL